MELYFLRHGATPGNLLGQYIGATDQPLAESGIAQAKSLAGYYPTPELLWVSPMGRARQTAELLFPGVPQRVMEGLRELDFGVWEEKTWEEVGDMTVYDRWLAEDPQAAFPGGETMEHFALRTTAALKQILQEAEAMGIQRGAVVAHGGVYMSLMHQYGAPGRKTFFDWMTKNCGGYRVAVQREPLRLDLLEELAP